MIYIHNERDFSKLFECFNKLELIHDVDIASLTKIEPYQLLIIAEYALLQINAYKNSTVYCNSSNYKLVEELGLDKYCNPLRDGDEATKKPIDYHIAPFSKVQSGRIDEHILKMELYFKSYCQGKEMTMINIVIAELLNNVFDHSDSPIGATSFCWYNPNRKSITIAIADLGIGIPGRVNKHFRTQGLKELSSVDAVKWALQEKTTTKSSPRNMGLGINNIIAFVKANRSKMMIYTGDTRFFADNYSSHIYNNPIKHFKGTIVQVDVIVKNLPDLDNDFENFSF